MSFVEPAPGEDRTPGKKLLMVILVGLLLAIPLFAMYLLVYDRQSQSDTARASIADGWGSAQLIAGPLLVIPYQALSTETRTEAGKEVTRTITVTRALFVSPQVETLSTQIKPERRKRSIYEAVVYEATVAGQARFTLPRDLSRYGIEPGSLMLDRAELRFGLSDARGLFGAPPQVKIAGQTLVLQPGKGMPETNGAGFFTWADATSLPTTGLVVDFRYAFRGNGSLTLSPRAGDTEWRITSPWPNPSFQGGFLPVQRKINADGFEATYRVGNIALGRSLVTTDEDAPVQRQIIEGATVEGGAEIGKLDASVSLVQPVDLYDQVNRATKYGFLFIGFTFVAFLMFDVIGGVRVSSVEYLLVGAALILFFSLLLAFAEVIGFTLAYIIASAAIIGLISAYSVAVLKSRQRAGVIGGLLIGLYATLYILLSLEAYSLLIGSLLLFVALAAVMYATRNLDWGRRHSNAA